MCRKSNVQQVAVSAQSAVRFVSQNFFCQNLAQLDTFLVEAVQIPCKSLERNFVLEVSKQGTDSLGSQLISNDDTGGTTAFKILVPIFVCFAASKGHDLGNHIGTELLLAGAALNFDVRAHLAIPETNKLPRNKVCALMQELIERMLAVGTRLAEDDRGR